MKERRFPVRISLLVRQPALQQKTGDVALPLMIL